MKYCKHCGSQIPDNAVCNCPDAVAERQAAQNVVRQQPPAGSYPRTGGYPQQQQQQQQQPVGSYPQTGGYPQQPGGYPQTGGYPQQPGGYPQQPGGYQPNPPRKNFGQKLIEPFTIYFKDPTKAVKNRINDKDFLTPLIYISVLFIVMLGVKCCIYGTEAVKGKPYIDYNFGFTILAAFICLIALCVAYVISRFLILIVCGKKPVNAGEIMLGSFISFGVNSIIPMGIMLVGGLFYMATSMLAFMFFALATVWYIAAGLLEIKDDFDPNGNVFLRLLMAGLIIGTFVALYFLLYHGMYVMNVRAVTTIRYYY